MDSQRPFCVFCQQTRDKVKLFSLETLQKSQAVLKIRISHNLKYKESVLPSIPDEISGYHSTCYRGFSALMKKYYEPINEPSSTSNAQPGSSFEEQTQQESAKDSSFERSPKVCFFAIKSEKLSRGKHIPFLNVISSLSTIFMSLHARLMIYS